MSLIDEFKQLGSFIMKDAPPTIKGLLSSKLASMLQQLQAYETEFRKRDETIVSQAGMIAKLEEENRLLKGAMAKLASG